jgi:iron(III) transport system permease protein
MTRWHLGAGAVLLLLVAPPIVLAASGLTAGQVWSTWRDADRLGILAGSSLLLAGLTVLVALPAGTMLAVFLFKSDLPGRAFLRRLVVVGLFLPLPLLATAWQSVFGDGLAIFTADSGRAWPSGLPAAVALHALAAVPWVVWLVGQGLTWVEPELEDDARLAADSWTVLWRVSLPRALPAISAAVIWIAAQTTTEIVVTDMTLIRTYAEEVYSQLVLPDDPNVAGATELAAPRAAAVAIPPMMLMALVLVVGVRWLERRSPARQSQQRDRPLIRLGRGRALAALGVTFVVIGFLTVPVASLAFRVGLAEVPPRWAVKTAAAVIHSTWVAHAGIVLASIAVAAAVGIAAAAIALISAWLARESTWFRGLVVVLAALCWAAPGPVIGIGLKQAINLLIDLESRWRGQFLATALYNGESLAPVLWADLVRLWPFALALLWPVVRSIPPELVEAARSDGASPSQELRLVIVPAAAPAFGRAALAVAVLALGELSASKIVATVGGQTLAHDVFTQMHYGVTPTLAAQCLLLLAIVLLVTLIPWPGGGRGD